MSIKHVISVSGGKDSAATLLIALERFRKENVVPIFCDTGNEHEAVYQYLDYLELALDIKITRLKANFDEEIAAKRRFIARDVRTRREYRPIHKTDCNGNPVWIKDRHGRVKMFEITGGTDDNLEDGTSPQYMPVQARGWDGGRKVRWTNKAKRRALAVLQPTGNPFLDLCLWKGRFPSRKAQFCTEQLKRNPAVEFQMALVAAGHTVVSWQGVRRDESLNRRNAKSFERVGPGHFIYRPIANWTAAQVFGYCGAQKIKANPLYLQGMSRVGCMPCINARKDELAQIARRFPLHFERIAEWEALTSLAAKRGHSTFFHKVDGQAGQLDAAIFARNNVHQVIQWAKTTRGGKQFDLLGDLEEVTACSSSYGLCE